MTAHPKKIGIFGGSFDPPHKAHLELLKTVEREMNLDKVIVVPSKFPPGKTPVASFKKRLDWCRKIFGAESVSILEERSEQTVFGKDIFLSLRLQDPNAVWCWILGEDQWNSLPFWKEIDSYAFQLEWIVLKRDNKKEAVKGILSRKLQTQTCAYCFSEGWQVSEISSSQIRAGFALQEIPESIREDVIHTYQKEVVV